MFNKAVIYINSIIEFAKINNRSVSGTALNVTTRIDWLPAVVLSPSAGVAALAWVLHMNRSVVIKTLFNSTLYLEFRIIVIFITHYLSKHNEFNLT